MVIVGLSPGLANQVYEYAAAYALARELKQELVLDISECIKASRGYMLDFFSIPDTRKIIYFGNDSEHCSHLDMLRLPRKLRENAIIFTENVQGGGVKYNCLDDVKNGIYSEDIYLFGYFFDRERYYGRYWNEIKNSFSLKIEMREVAMFRSLIADKISVGIHVRRGDMLLADWAEKMEDDYYRAAIAYCRKHLGKCSFFIFSDDIAYAKKMLGKDSSLWYVNFGGSQEADIAEFICLSLCNHRILSNSSTFGELADELNTNEDSKTFFQLERKLRVTRIDRVKKFMWLKIFKKPWSRMKLDKWDIRKYSSYYKANGMDNITNYQKRKEEVLHAIVTKDNYESILNEIEHLSFNVYERTGEEESRLLYQKFTALMLAGKYQSALTVKERIYEDYINDHMFRDNLIKALKQAGAYKEAEMEANRTLEAKHFVIIPAGKTIASGRKFGLIELGIVLHHFGHKVSLVLEPRDKTEMYYITNNEILTDRQGKLLGCRQYLQEIVEQKGFERFLNEFQEDELFVVTRKKDFCGQKLGQKQVTYIFPDFTDRRDEEFKVGSRMRSEDIEFLYNNADFVLSCDANKKDDSNYIIWENSDDKKEYCMIDRRWDMGDSDRLSERTICKAEALLERLIGESVLKMSHE